MMTDDKKKKIVEKIEQVFKAINNMTAISVNHNINSTSITNNVNK